MKNILGVMLFLVSSGCGAPDAGKEHWVVLDPSPDAGVASVSDTGDGHDADAAPVPDEGLPVDTGPVCPGQAPIPQVAFHTESGIRVGGWVGLRADLTKSFNGSYTVKWTARDAPDGSARMFLPSPHDVNVLFVLDEPGYYSFEIEIEDSCGLKTTVWLENKITVAVASEEIGLRIVTGWIGFPISFAPHMFGSTAPFGDSDIDLHFADPKAPFDLGQTKDLDGDKAPDPWFDPFGGDCWGASTGTTYPDWGKAGDSSDNPHCQSNSPKDPTSFLETTTYKYPYAGPYRMGVHHTGGLHQVYAYAIAFLHGKRVMDTVARGLNPGDMWCIGQIAGWTGTSVPCAGAAVVPGYSKLSEESD